MIYSYQDIRKVHLEPSTRCNAACPMCPRYVDGGAGLNQHMPLTELTLKDVQTIFPKYFIWRLDVLYSCGNFGDPAACRELLDIYDYFRTENPTFRLGLYTNASLRTKNWWADLARTIKRRSNSHGWVTFSIDGLEDTNHLYRVGTNWQKIMENAQSYIDAGGYAEWEFIVFQHNEHQVEEARKLAHEMGFRDFIVKKTHRFQTPEIAVRNRKGETTHHISPPSTKDYQHKSVKQTSHVPVQTESVQIDCKVKPQGNIFVSASGHVFPCCYLASNWWTTQDEMTPLINSAGGPDRIDAKKYSIQEIVEGPLFRSIEQSWFKYEIKPCGRLATCTQVCGLKHRVTRVSELNHDQI